MKTPNATELQYLAYEKIFKYYNHSLFQDALPGVILSFARSTKFHGYFAPERWVDNSEVKAHEIALNPKTLGRQPIEVLSTLVHEMVHLWQMEFGMKKSRRGYHNKEWAAKMETVGLIPSDTGEPGGKKVGTSMTHYIQAGGAFEKSFEAMPKDYLFPFQSMEHIPTSTGGNGGEGEGDDDEPKTRNKIKYTCPGCSSNVWGRPGLAILCKPCSQVYEEC